MRRSRHWAKSKNPSPGAGFTTPSTIIYVCYPIPTPARFRPLGPPMFDSPKIAS